MILQVNTPSHSDIFMQVMVRVCLRDAKFLEEKSTYSQRPSQGSRDLETVTLRRRGEKPEMKPKSRHLVSIYSVNKKKIKPLSLGRPMFSEFL